MVGAAAEARRVEVVAGCVVGGTVGTLSLEEFGAVGIVEGVVGDRGEDG